MERKKEIEYLEKEVLELKINNHSDYRERKAMELQVMALKQEERKIELMESISKSLELLSKNNTL